MDDRLAHVRDVLQEQALDALLVTSPANIIYLTEYAGFSEIEREAYLLISQNNQYLFTDGRYTTAIKELVPHFTTVETTSQTPFLKQLETVKIEGKLTTLGIEAENLTVAEFSKIKPLFTIIKPVNLHNLHIIKTNEEIAIVRKACQLGDETFAHILTKIKPGMSEKEVALEMELHIRRHGGTLSFPTIVAFGKNSAVPHHMTSDQRLKTNDIILLDFGIEIDNYCSDMTRTIFIGEPTEEQKRVYETVLESQEKAVSCLTSHLSAHSPTPQTLKTSDVDKAARDYILAQDYPSIPHALGHGIGLEVHESPTLSPRSEETFSDGMIFSIEPGIYLPGKFGVRIEDLFAIQNGKLLQLTRAPRNLIQL